jgi:transcription antitermination factor NusG
VDKRDDIAWVVVELSYLGETKVSEGTLLSLLHKESKLSLSHPVFIPSITYSKSGEVVTFHLMEGYIFIATGLPEPFYFGLEQSPYVERVITTERSPSRFLNTVQNRYIEDLRKKLREMVSTDLEEGMDVKILDGTYAKLQGKVVGLLDEVASVFLELRSAHFIVSIPRAFLEPAS